LIREACLVETIRKLECIINTALKLVPMKYLKVQAQNLVIKSIDVLLITLMAYLHFKVQLLSCM